MAFDIVGKSEDKQLAAFGPVIMEGTSHPIRLDWLSDGDLCYRFHEGNQLTAEESKVLKDRNQPDIVYNECVQVVERTIGQYTRQRMQNTLVGRNTPVDDGLASVPSEVHRFTDQDTDYLFAMDSLPVSVCWSAASRAKQWADRASLLMSRTHSPSLLIHFVDDMIGTLPEEEPGIFFDTLG